MSDRPMTEPEEELVDTMNEYYDRLAAITKKYAHPGIEQEQIEQMLAEMKDLREEFMEKKDANKD